MCSLMRDIALTFSTSAAHLDPLLVVNAMRLAIARIQQIQLVFPRHQQRQRHAPIPQTLASHIVVISKLQVHLRDLGKKDWEIESISRERRFKIWSYVVRDSIGLPILQQSEL